MATTRILRPTVLKELAHAGWMRLAEINDGMYGGIRYRISVDHWALPEGMTDDDLLDFFGNQGMRQDYMHLEALLHWDYNSREQAERMFTMAVLKWGTREREQGVF